MLRIISIACFTTFFFCSCKKDKLDIPIGTIKVEIGGSTSTFNIQAKATRLTVTGGYGIQLQGNLKTTSTTNLSFSIVSPNPILNDTYTENTTSNPLVSMTHCIEFYSPCVIRANEYGSTTNPVAITITEISSSSVKGTFKGELQGIISKEVLSNGVFYVSF